jgi:hypothetical protein
LPKYLSAVVIIKLPKPPVTTVGMIGAVCTPTTVLAYAVGILALSAGHVLALSVCKVVIIVLLTPQVLATLTVSIKFSTNGREEYDATELVRDTGLVMPTLSNTPAHAINCNGV